MEGRKPLSDTEIDQLAEFLTSGETPGECMDLSTLDGFLTGLVIGPDSIPPSQWLPAVWGDTTTDKMVWKSKKKMERIWDLIMRQYNSIVQAFQADPPDFSPVLPVHEAAGEEVIIIDEWCWGLMCSVELAPESWQPMLEDEEQGAALIPISLHGTEEGWKLLKEDPEFSAVTHEEWVAMLPAAVREIYEFWLPVRRAEAQVSRVALSQKVGRNEPCPCGSGKKYKKCHGALESRS